MLVAIYQSYGHMFIFSWLSQIGRRLPKKSQNQKVFLSIANSAKFPFDSDFVGFVSSVSIMDITCIHTH